MFYKPLLIPLLIQVALTFAVLFTMFARRVSEFKRKRVHPQKTATRTDQRAVLTDSATAADNFQNLFELPVLFYTAILLALNLLLQDPLLVALAWTYVATRLAHSMVHVTYNDVMHRFYCFACSVLVLLMIWVRLGWLILLH